MPATYHVGHLTTYVMEKAMLADAYMSAILLDIFLGIYALFSMHYHDVIMGAMASQITSTMIVYSTVYSGTDERKHRSFVSLAFVWGIHRWLGIPHTKGQ